MAARRRNAHGQLIYAVLNRAAVQQQLDTDTTLVSYYLGTEQTLAFVLTRSQFHALNLPIGNQQLYTQVHSLRESPDFALGTSLGFARPSHPAEAVALYNELIAPLKPYLTTPHLTIVPHHVLHYLPFASLSDGTRYLIDDYSLSLLPSASVLPFVNAPPAEISESPLILGNPDGTLIAAQSEAEAVGQFYRTQPLLGSQATKDVLMQKAWGTGILHIAAHGRYDERDPLASSLQLAAGADPKNSALTTADVYRLNLKQAQLVVLSACETNVGNVGQGDEVVGLTRAFFFAGTPTVVSSLWKVDDKATALLMERFYNHLRAGRGKAEALRLAQQELRARYPAPYYWAGFVLSGEIGPIRPRPPWEWIAAVAVLLTVVLVAVPILRAERRQRRRRYGWGYSRRYQPSLSKRMADYLQGWRQLLRRPGPVPRPAVRARSWLLRWSQKASTSAASARPGSQTQPASTRLNRVEGSATSRQVSQHPDPGTPVIRPAPEDADLLALLLAQAPKQPAPADDWLAELLAGEPRRHEGSISDAGC